MKTFTIDIHPELQNVTLTVKNGRAFTEASTKGAWRRFAIAIAHEDISRVKKFAVKHGNDNNSNRGHWYAHCNGYAMGLLVHYDNRAEINTYRPYGKTK